MRFSVIASHASAANGARSCASASSVASATALPFISVCMSSIERWGLRFTPAVSEVRNASSGLIVPGAHGEEGVGTGAPQGALVPPAQGEMVPPGKGSDRPAVTLRVQHIRWQGRQPARKIGARGGGGGVTRIDTLLAE